MAFVIYVGLAVDPQILVEWTCIDEKRATTFRCLGHILARSQQFRAFGFRPPVSLGGNRRVCSNLATIGQPLGQAAVQDRNCVMAEILQLPVHAGRHRHITIADALCDDDDRAIFVDAGSLNQIRKGGFFGQHAQDLSAIDYPRRADLAVVHESRSGDVATNAEKPFFPCPLVHIENGSCGKALHVGAHGENDDLVLVSRQPTGLHERTWKLAGIGLRSRNRYQD